MVVVDPETGDGVKIEREIERAVIVGMARYDFRKTIRI